MDDALNINNEIKNEIYNNNESQKNNINNKNSYPIIMNKLPLNDIKEKIYNNEIYIESAPPSDHNVNNQKRKLAYSTTIVGNIFEIPKQPSFGLFNEESKSDDEDNIKDKMQDILEDEENEGRKSIYSNNSKEIEIHDNEEYIKKLEEKWKYEKILLDYNIIDFTSK